MPPFDEKNLHVVAFNVPYPPDYGGVIDAFYKLKAFNELGVHIHLHCFDYGRGHQAALDNVCASVTYYPRRGLLTSLVGKLPYIVSSRRSEALLNNLRGDDFPILFEGIHSCFYLNNPALQGRMRAVRLYNVESRYYQNLGSLHRNPFQKVFFAVESLRLARFEPAVSGANVVFPISEEETAHFHRFNPNTLHIPPFHGNAKVAKHEAPRGDYLLFHGDLSTRDNHQAALFLIREVFSKTGIPFVIAGRSPAPALVSTLSAFPAGRLAANPSEEDMDGLMRGAQVVVLWSPAQSGFRLKLLNSLFKGRFCAANPAVVKGTGLESLCEVTESADALRAKILDLIPKPFSSTERERRVALLAGPFSDLKNGERMLGKIFGLKS